MRSRFSRPVLAAVHALTAAVVVVGTGREARAQACCAGAATITAARLGPAEVAVVGLQTRTGWVYGAYGNRGGYAANGPGVREVDLEQSMIGTLRVARRGQASVLVPFAETWRTSPETGGAAGAGLGDLVLSGRYDFVLAGTRTLPGIAMLAGVTFPAGRAAESSSRPLATDATATGVWQASLGGAVEQSSGPWLVGVALTLALRAPGTVGPVTSRRGPYVSAVGSLGYAFFGKGAIGLGVGYTWESDASFMGTSQPWTARQLLRLSFSGTRSVGEVWRLQGGLYGDIPADSLGQNTHASVGWTLGVTRSFL